MVSSMTGFVCQNLAIEVAQGEHCLITINLKSLNSRFFEVTCKLPPALNQYETDLIKILKPQLQRGHIYLTIHVSKPNLFNSQITADAHLVQAYLATIAQLKTQTKITGELTVSDLVQLPGIFNLSENPDNSKIKTQLLQTISQLCAELNQERAREGAGLQTELLQIAQSMQAHLLTIESEFQRSFSTQKKLVQTKITELQQLAQLTATNSNSTQTEANLITPDYLSYTLDKLDIHEELSRFNEHVQNFSKVLQNSNFSKGKQLDFILQECMREVNTLSAKANNALISTLAIEIKVELEKAREQVQNIV